MPLTGQSSSTWPALRSTASAAQFVVEREGRSFDHDAARNTGAGDGRDNRRKRRGFRQTKNDGRRCARDRHRVRGDLDAYSGQRAPPRRSNIMADDAPARGNEIFRESAAHDAETDNTDDRLSS